MKDTNDLWCVFMPDVYFPCTLCPNLGPNVVERVEGKKEKLQITIDEE